MNYTPNTDPIEAARQELYRICKAENNFRMSIPVQDYDSDQIIMRGLDAAEQGRNLLAMIHSGIDLVQRFGVQQDPAAAVDKLREEVAEFINATEPEDIAEEACDVIVTLFNALNARGISSGMLDTAMQRVAAKNDAKTDVTHVVHNGLIMRRNKIEALSDG